MFSTLPDVSSTGVATPAPLVVAATVAGVQGLLFVGYAVLELAHLTGSRVAMGLTTSGFFGIYGLALLLCAWRMARLDSWARSPLVLAQLIHLGLAWNFWGGSTRPVSVAIVVSAGVVLAGIFHPASISALAED